MQPWHQTSTEHRRKTATALNSSQQVVSRITRLSPSLCLPEHDPCFILQQKTNIKCAGFCFTSATVYLPGPRLLLFLHVPDIIIAVRGMIICLLWKLADCLSPVPEELPLKGVPLEKHHKSGCSTAQMHDGADRMKTERKLLRERRRWKATVSMGRFYLYRTIHHASSSASSTERAGLQTLEGRFWKS